ncbi:class I adenylate-forming enzyme family protein [Cytobacillus firmus]|uniref:class I adenylate-forming enzyme family protein n=1 Tax=Cytobacillus firmus TaxID=1399 RepID=UPI003001916C
MILTRLKEFDNKICILNTNVTYKELVKSAERNCAILKKYFRNQVILLDISLGWRIVPIIIGALIAKITIVPVDLSKNPSIAKLFPSSLVLTNTNVNAEGEITQDVTNHIQLRSKDPELKEVAYIMFTSGTTGKPKGIKLTFDNIFSNVTNIIQYAELNRDDNVLIIRPVTNISAITGELIPSLLAGSSIYIKDPQSSPLSALNIISDFNINTVFTTPSLALKIISFDKKHKINTINLIVLSGERLTKDVYKKLIDHHPKLKVWNAYGLSEASPRISVKKIKDNCFETGCVGKPLKDVNIKIIDEEGRPVKEGQAGELLVHGPNIMAGYYQNGSLTKDKLVNGWLSTGDIAYMYNQELYIQGRKDNMIIKWGMNIFPEEIEEAICKHPEITHAIVFPIYQNNQVIINAKVIKTPGSQLTAEKLLSYMVTNYKDSRLWIDNVTFEESLSVTQSGKISRNLRC